MALNAKGREIQSQETGGVQRTYGGKPIFSGNSSATKGSVRENFGAAVFRVLSSPTRLTGKTFQIAAFRNFEKIVSKTIKTSASLTFYVRFTRLYARRFLFVFAFHTNVIIVSFF